MRSKKQHIRLWYECLQICHSQPQYAENLAASAAFYREWGQVVGVKFDQWWREKRYLFDEVRVREVAKVSNTSNTVTLSIPLNEKISTITADVKKIIEKKQIERLKELGVDYTALKSKNLSVGKYSFTQKEVKGLFHYVNLEIYKIYLQLGRPSINRQFIIEIRKSFDSRKRSQLRKSVLYLPTMDQFETIFLTNVDLDNQIRTVRRGIKGVEKTLANVSKGQFP
jgi:hypothetical protein